MHVKERVVLLTSTAAMATDMMSTYTQDTQQACTHHTHVQLLHWHTYVLHKDSGTVNTLKEPYGYLHSPENLHMYAWFGRIHVDSQWPE